MVPLVMVGLLPVRIKTFLMKRVMSMLMKMNMSSLGNNEGSKSGVDAALLQVHLEMHVFVGAHHQSETTLFTGS